MSPGFDLEKKHDPHRAEKYTKHEFIGVFWEENVLRVSIG